ncbi:hypothetical protein AR1Y2_0893 [Anaerostipes rhamnosivorans]|uniref:Uncharacterized protein n=1 Tax=Anaerostipes rhamnosivorans TaxID=1229621 RepID=A0A4P8ICU1_9FIRM|nr:hypothetical protein AR1Y2_0893 [Anaerostipes rhamnosivorans]
MLYLLIIVHFAPFFLQYKTDRPSVYSAKTASCLHGRILLQLTFVEQLLLNHINLHFICLLISAIQKNNRRRSTIVFTSSRSLAF